MYRIGASLIFGMSVIQDVVSVRDHASCFT